MPNSLGKTREDPAFFPCFSLGAMRPLVLYFVALNAVAVSGKRRAPHPMTGCAGRLVGLRDPMQSLAVINWRPRLRKDLGMADRAIALDPLVVQLMGERALAVLI